MLVLALTQIGAAPALAPVASAAPEPASVPLVAVIANPDRYDGKRVWVEGFLNLAFEGDALYLGRSDRDAGLMRNSVWVDGPNFEEPEARRALNGRYVMLQGRFNTHSNGHFGMHTGTFEDVSSIVVMYSWEQSIANDFSFHPDLPWPLLILVLLPASVLTVFILAIQKRRARAGARPAVVGLALGLASIVVVFSVCRLWELPLLVPSLLRTDHPLLALPPPPLGPTLLLELIVGVLALAASVGFALRRNMLLCMVFAVVQLIVPAFIEARAFLILDAPFSIYSAQAAPYRWTSPAPTLPN
jgi:hypothetical protein